VSAGLSAWYAALNAIVPSKRNHHSDGAVPVVSVFSHLGRNVTTVSGCDWPLLPSCPRAQFDALNDGDRLYLVPEGLLFVWPFVSVGHNVTLPADLLQLPVGHEPIVIESISASPLVFKLHNFFSGAEADELIRAAEAITDPQFMLKRSATGVHTDPDKVVYATTRTSENAFDPNTPTAMTLKRRMFELLRIPEYQEDMADGLQLLRYRQKQAYIPHHDWFDDGADPTFNFDPATGGSNRFATVFLYLSDVELAARRSSRSSTRPARPSPALSATRCRRSPPSSSTSPTGSSTSCASATRSSR
jgi:hypothetical protein